MSGFCCCTNLIVELILIRRILAVSHKNLPFGGESRDIFFVLIFGQNWSEK